MGNVIINMKSTPLTFQFLAVKLFSLLCPFFFLLLFCQPETRSHELFPVQLQWLVHHDDTRALLKTNISGIRRGQ